jgi:hypothetical protein
VGARNERVEEIIEIGCRSTLEQLAPRLPNTMKNQ